MDELFLAVLEIFGELLLQVLAELIFDFVSRAIAEIFEDSEIKNPNLAFVGYGLLGLIAGVLSIFLFPHPLFRSGRIRGISLLVSPLITGLLMSVVGSVLRRHEKDIVRIESFAYGSVFAFGMALVRLLFTK